MARQDLKIFTTISFYIALMAVVTLPVCLFLLSTTADNDRAPLVKLIASLAFLISLAGIPLSTLSMFSKENLAKRIFALTVNLLPICLLLYILVMEFIDEFFRTAP